LFGGCDEAPEKLVVLKFRATEKTAFSRTGGCRVCAAGGLISCDSTGRITGKVADEALEFFQRSKAECSKQLRSAR
jgi:hypothetical protein